MQKRQSVSRIYWIFSFTFALWLGVGRAADVPPAREAAADLEHVLAAVISRNAQVAEAEADVDIARRQLERARAAAWPAGGFVLVGAPIPEFRGNPNTSTTNWGKWGPYVNASGQLALPLYTFGQLGGYKKAAENQIAANSQLVLAKRNDVILSAKEFYYGYLMAGDLERLVDDTVSFLDEAVKTAENSDNDKKNTVKPHDLFKLKTTLDDLKQKKLLAGSLRQTAERAVIWISGESFSAVQGKAIAPEKFEKRSLDEYLKMAIETRPELKALAAGQTARKALADAKQAQSYPALFIGGFLNASWSNNADAQTSIFAYDPFNRIMGGGGIGLKLDVEFARHAAEAAEENAQAMKLEATERYARPGIDLQVKRAFWELEQAQAGLEIAKHRRDLGKKWFISNGMGWSIGVTVAKDLLESLEGSATAKKNYVESIYAFNMALAHLSQAVGKEVSALSVPATRLPSSEMSATDTVMQVHTTAKPEGTPETAPAAKLPAPPPPVAPPEAN